MLTIFYAWIWPIWVKRPILILSIFIIPTILIIGQVSIPWFTRELLNALYEKNNIHTQSLYLACTWGLSKLIIRIQIFLNAIPISNFIQDIRVTVLKAILQLDYDQRTKKSPSNWTQLTMDISKSVEYIYGMLIWNILPTLGLFTLILIEVYGIYPLFFWVYLSYIIMQLSIMWYLRKSISIKSQSHNKAKNELIENYAPLFKPNIIFFNPDQTTQLLKHFKRYAQSEIQSRNHLIRAINMTRLLMDLIAIGVFTAILILMIHKHETLLIGDLSFIIMTLISTIDKAWSLGQNWCDLQSAIGLLNNYKWLTKIESQDHQKHSPQLQSTEMHIKNLSFSYNQTKFVFNNLNFSVPNCRIVGITGTPGSGKSTFMKILFGTLHPQDGLLYLSNHNILCKPPEQRNQYMNFISQEPTLYSNLDIEANLMLTNVNVTPKEMNAALTKAHCQLLDKNTLTKYLSGGQKQQLCIARAFLEDKPIWLLDEALSAVDEKTHRTIMTNIIRNTNIKKIIIISHQQRDHALYQAKINIQPMTDLNYQVPSAT